MKEKPTKEQQKEALALIANKLKTVKGNLIFKKVCVNNSIIEECQRIAEEVGVPFEIDYNMTGSEDLKYWPTSPHENGWYDPDAPYDEGLGFWWASNYQGWMSSTDQCNASY